MSDIFVSSTRGGNEFYFLPLDSYGWVLTLVMGHEYKIEWRDAGLSARTMTLALGVPEYLIESIEKRRNESVLINFSPYMYDYRPYNFNVTYRKQMRYASLNRTVSHSSRMGASMFFNNTLTTVLSNRKADLLSDAVILLKMLT